jgi:hypothetical protein
VRSSGVTSSYRKFQGEGSLVVLPQPRAGDKRWAGLEWIGLLTGMVLRSARGKTSRGKDAAWRKTSEEKGGHCMI